jgi:hypothetical protein
MQIGGDMNPGTYGGTIAKADGNSIEMLKIMPIREYVGDRDAVDLGFPFWSKVGYFNLADLQPDEHDVINVMDSSGLTDETLQTLKPESRAMVIAEALLDYGRGDEGESGWAKDIIGNRMVKWWGSKRPAGWRYLADEDAEFRRLLRENR